MGLTASRSQAIRKPAGTGRLSIVLRLLRNKMTDAAQTMIILYGTNWCPDSRRARSVLDEKGISYKFVDIDQDMDGRRFVEKTNKGNRSVPTILFADGSVLVEPSNATLLKKLGF
jgi:mycoredoxin